MNSIETYVINPLNLPGSESPSRARYISFAIVNIYINDKSTEVKKMPYDEVFALFLSPSGGALVVVLVDDVLHLGLVVEHALAVLLGLAELQK